MGTRLLASIGPAVARVAAVLLLGTGAARADDAVLVSSTVPEHVPGMIVAEDDTFALPPGAGAVLLFRSGEMVRLNGPFDGRLAAARSAGAANGVAGLVRFLRGQGVDASVMGATRAATSAPPPDDRDVTVNLERSGIYCLGPADTVWLHRPTTGAPPPRLRRGGSVRELSWPAQALRIEWPPDVIIEDGDRFEALDEAGMPRASMIFRRLAPPPSRAAWVAQSLLLGCRDQAEPALQTLARSLEGGGR